MNQIYIKKYNQYGVVIAEDITGYKGLKRLPVDCILVQLNDPLDKQSVLVEVVKS